MEKFDHLLWVVKELRAKCPWDKKQTHQSLKKYFIEEVYEALDALEKNDFDEFENELGDVLLQILLHSEIASETNKFAIDGVIEQITKKMIDRHPHVFGDNPDESIDTEQVLENWESLKAKDKKRKRLLSGIPNSLPALIRAQRIQEKTAHVGFDWSNINDVFSKVQEEIKELDDEIKANNHEKIREEMGDLIFSLVNLGRHLNIDVEDALQQSNSKFKQRFEFVEQQYKSIDELKQAGLDELDSHWNQAKKQNL